MPLNEKRVFTVAQRKQMEATYEQAVTVTRQGLQPRRTIWPCRFGSLVSSTVDLVRGDAEEALDKDIVDRINFCRMQKFISLKHTIS